MGDYPVASYTLEQACKAVWDKLPKSANTMTGYFGNSGRVMFMAYQYDNGSNGMMQVMRVWSNAIGTMTVLSGTKYFKIIDPDAIDELRSNMAVSTQLLYTSGVPTTATSYSLNQAFTNYNFLLLEFRQYGNIWAQYILPTSYFDSTAEGSRPVLFYVDTNGARTTINVYKNTTSSVYIKSNVEYGTAYHVVILGLYKK